MPNGGERSHTRTPRRSLSPVGTFPGVPMKTPRDSNAEYTHRVFKWSVRELEDQGYSLNVHMKCQVGRLVRFDWSWTDQRGSTTPMTPSAWTIGPNPTMALDHAMYADPEKMCVLNACWNVLPHIAQGKFGVKDAGLMSYWAMYGSDWRFPVNPGGPGQFTLNIVKLGREHVPTMLETLGCGIHWEDGVLLRDGPEDFGLLGVLL